MFIIAGKYYRHPIIAPKGLQTRPTSSRLRETVFNILQDDIENKSFLDIFAGSGAMGLEAISRGAKEVTFIELNKEAIRCLQTNLKNLKIATGTVLMGDFLKILERLNQEGKTFDIVFADAPYGMQKGDLTVSEKLLHWLSSHPLLKIGGRLFIEDDCEKSPHKENSTLQWVNSRRSGKAYLHQYVRL